MLQQDRLSAVAKRRRLNELSSSVVQPAQRAVTKASLIPIPVGDPKTSRDKSPSPSPPPTQYGGNTFQALVANDMVSFQSVQNVTAVNERTFKVSFLKGQKILIVGEFLLWVRNGTIRLSGAVIDAKTLVQHVHHLEDTHVPAVHCISESAEFQLEHVEANEANFGNTAVYKWRLPEDDNVYHLSFVLNGMQHAGSSATSPAVYRFQELTLPFPKELLQAIREQPRDSIYHTPRILFCGRTFSDIESTMLNLWNHLLTNEDHAEGAAESSGILVLDLDLHAAYFTPPGIVGLVRLKRPIFGPVHQHSGDDYTILAMQFFGHPEVAVQERLQFPALMLALRRARTQYPRSPLVIQACDVLEYLRDEEIESFTNLIMPTQAICFGNEDSIAKHLFKVLVRDGIPIHRVDSVKPSTSVRVTSHRARLRAYLEGANHQSDRTRPTPFQDISMKPWVQLNYRVGCVDTPIRAVHMAEELWQSHGCLEKLLGSVVAIMLEPENATWIHGRMRPEPVRADISGPGFPSKAGHMLEDASLVLSRAGRANAGGLPVVHRGGMSCAPVGLTYECIGLGIVAAILVDQQTVQLETPVSHTEICAWLSKGRRFHLVVPTPGIA